MLKNLGNLVQRVVKFAHAKMGAKVPEYAKKEVPTFDQHKAEVNKLLQDYISNLKATKLRAGLATTMLYVWSPSCWAAEAHCLTRNGLNTNII